MNPWLNEQLGAAHRSELQRVAAQQQTTRTGRRRQPAGGEGHRPRRAAPSPAAMVGRARLTTGLLLVRAGNRLAG